MQMLWELRFDVKGSWPQSVPHTSPALVVQTQTGSPKHRAPHAEEFNVYLAIPAGIYRCSAGKIQYHPMAVYQTEHPLSQGLQLHFENYQGEVFVLNILISSVAQTRHTYGMFLNTMSQGLYQSSYNLVQ